MIIRNTPTFFDKLSQVEKSQNKRDHIQKAVLNSPLSTATASSLYRSAVWAEPPLNASFDFTKAEKALTVKAKAEKAGKSIVTIEHFHRFRVPPLRDKRL